MYSFGTFVFWLLCATLFPSQANASAAIWNGKYSSKGISYSTTNEDEYVMWWDNSHHYRKILSFSPKTCSGCMCLETGNITCSGPTVNVIRQSFTHLGNENTVSGSISSMKIGYVTSFTSLIGNPLRNISSLSTLVIQDTSLRDFPNIEGTAMRFMKLAYNKVEYFVINYTRQMFPSSLTHLGVIHNNLRWIPDDAYSDTQIQFLSLAFNKIEQFPETAIKNMAKLKYLGLEGNKLRYISRKNLGVITSSDFVHLNLSNNDIEFIEEGALIQLENLKILELHRNKIKTIHPNVMNSLGALLHLDLNSNSLSLSNAGSLKNLSNLMELWLQQQSPKMTTIHYQAFQDVGAELKFLSVGKNALTHFPHPVLNENDFPKLDTIWCNQNLISNLSIYDYAAFGTRLGAMYDLKLAEFKPFVTLGNLKTLFLSSNKINALNKNELYKLYGLRNLYLSGNVLTEAAIVENAFENNTQLNLLYLGYNLLQYVPMAVRNKSVVPALNNLNMNSNQLTFLSKGTFTNVTTLSLLSVASNRIISVEDETFNEGINTIMMQGNDFRFLNEKPFANLPNLVTLMLHSNSMDQIPLFAFRNSTSLQNLYLYTNKLTYILQNHFKNGSSFTNGAIFLQNNKIAYIEDGTFTPFTAIAQIYLSSNRLTRLPNGGDLSNKTTQLRLTLSSNQLTKIPTGQFSSVVIISSLSFSNNKVSKIETNAFNNVTVVQAIFRDNIIDFTGNPIQDVQSMAFNMVSAYRILIGNTEFLKQLPSYAFNNVRITNSLQIIGTNLSSFDLNKFENGTITDQSSPFNGSDIALLNLDSNQLTSLPDELFKGSIIRKISLQNNQLTLFPSVALSSQPLTDITITNNKIAHISSVLGLGTLTSLLKLYLMNNELEGLSPTTFSNARNLREIYFQNNKITTIDGVFDGLTSLRLLHLTNNALVHLPEMKNLPSLTTLDLRQNPIVTVHPQAFSGLTSSSTLSISFKAGHLSCTCNTYTAFSALTEGTFVGTTCAAPPSLTAATMIAGGATGASEDQFMCSPENATATVGQNSILVKWNNPSALTSNDTTFDAVGTATVTCTNLISGGSIIHTVNLQTTTQSVFTTSEGIQAGHRYRCYIHFTINNTVTGNSNPAVGFLSLPFSQASAAGDIVMNSWYFEFTTNHSYFDPLHKPIPSDLIYTFSHYGSYLYQDHIPPTTDSFTELFREVSNVNRKFILTLRVPHVAGTTNPTVNRLWLNESFYPIDALGNSISYHGDCNDIYHKLKFTALYRNSLNYTGNAEMIIGTVEDAWIYLNGTLLASHHDSGLTGTHNCTFISLKKTNVQGGGIVERRTGTLVGNTCSLSGTTETVNASLILEVHKLYRLEIFLIKRLSCSSSLFVEFRDAIITDALSSLHVDVAENLPQGYLITRFDFQDHFSVGSNYKLTFITGNTEGHFALSANNLSYVQPATPDPYGVNTTLPGIPTWFLTCPGTPPAPPALAMPPNEVTVATSSAMLTIHRLFDYETQSRQYTVTIRVTELGSTPRTGTVRFDVSIMDFNDNCPQLTQTNFSFRLVPALRQHSMFRLNATDLDGSTENNNFTFYASDATLQPEIDITNQTLDIHRQIYLYNTTLVFNIVALDNGYPPRGATANVSLVLSNTCVVNVVFEEIPRKFVFDHLTGDAYFQIPKYWVFDYKCMDNVGIGVHNAWLRDELITASSHEPLSYPGRGRLHEQLGSVKGLTGGWIPQTMDANQFIEVDLQTEHNITGVILQGQANASNWVTTFSVQYKNGASWITYSESGVTVFPANINNNATVQKNFTEPFNALHVRILPKTWNNKIALRFELIGCTVLKQTYYRVSCVRCPTGYYCPGDGTSTQCASVNKTEHSFGGNDQCVPCPVGWSCTDGYATPCPIYNFVTCLGNACNCTACPSGHACRGGRRFICRPGTYSNGTMKFCELCEDGTFQNQYGQSSCLPCPSGHYSTKMKISCNICPMGTYTDPASKGCLPCTSTTECPCTASTSPCYTKDICYNLSPSDNPRYACGNCPAGYRGNGVTCTDIDECVELQPCWNATRCVNTQPGYQCLACPLGYEGSFEDALAGPNDTLRVFTTKSKYLPGVVRQVCRDIDECQSSQTNTCASKAVCTNTIGSYRCGPCLSGFIGDPYYSCYPDNFCTNGKHNCSTNAGCTYIRPGRYRCNCGFGYAGNGRGCSKDGDMDGAPDEYADCPDPICARDNCKDLPNSGQEDADNDKIGNVCDDDADNDGKTNDIDNCPFVANLNQLDSDGDGVGDSCDNCVNNANPDQADNDKDGTGDVCDDDDDNDTILDTADNCPMVPNTVQTDTDGDGVGDACDNCPKISNANQADVDQNGFGDACDPVTGSNRDMDGDGIPDAMDNCPHLANADQLDTDGDGNGDVCDPDRDNDGILDRQDNCPLVANADQKDSDGDGVGDACVPDYDSDGVGDEDDSCPGNKLRHVTNFTGYITVLFGGNTSDTVLWEMNHGGREVRLKNSPAQPVALIGPESYGSVDYSGTFYVDATTGQDFIGFIFGYQSNRRFYLVLWRTNNLNIGSSASVTGALRGLTIKYVNWLGGPSPGLAQALWKSSDSDAVSGSTPQCMLLWQDPNMLGWKHKTAYRWYLTWRPSIGLIRVRIYEGDNEIVDSNNVYSTAISGGRLGVFNYNQTGSIWSNLETRCVERLNNALYFDAANETYVKLGNLTEMKIIDSFTLEVWVNPDSNSTGPQPILCTLNSTLCLSIENDVTVARLAETTITGARSIPSGQWTHIVMRFSDQDHILDIYVNSTTRDATRNHVYLPTSWGSYDADVYLGRNSQSFFSGEMDEVRLYGRALPDAEISQHMQLAALEDAVDGNYIHVHYTMDENESASILYDKGILRVNGQIQGAKFVESRLDNGRFQVSYPLNRRKREAVRDEL